MPLIQLKTTAELTPALRDELTSDFGKMMAEAGKPESFLMIAFEDDVDLRFSGKKMKNGALVEIKQVGDLGGDVYLCLTTAVTRILKERLGIDPQSIYITYQPVDDWGWNGTNF